jgi:hypothetical protein
LEPAPPTFERRSQEPGVEVILSGAEEALAPDVQIEHRWARATRRTATRPWGWFALLAAVGIGMALWSLQWLARHRDAIGRSSARAEEIELAEQQRNAQAEQLYQRLEQRVAGYLAAGSVDELLLHTRRPDRVAPLMRSWYAEGAPQAARFLGFEAFQPVTLERRPFWMIRANTSAGPRELLVEQTDDDDGRVDWETDVCYQPMPWDKFARERPEGKFAFRVRAAVDHYYAYEFADERRFQCFRLAVPGSEEHLFGYVERGSATDRTLVRLLGAGGADVPVVLELGYVPGGAKRMVAISAVTSPRWCVIDPADE